jgi:hypothetical protein
MRSCFRTGGDLISGAVSAPKVLQCFFYYPMNYSQDASAHLSLIPDFILPASVVSGLEFWLFREGTEENPRQKGSLQAKKACSRLK